MSYALYLDTGGKISTVALFKNGTLLVSKQNHDMKNHNAALHEHIRENLEEMGLHMHELSELWVMNGPGSYTGLRTGLSVAKGICYALNLPLFLIHRFDAVFWSQEKADCIVLFHARADEYFMCVYRNYAIHENPKLILKNEMLEYVIKHQLPIISDEEHVMEELHVEVILPNPTSFTRFIQSDLKESYRADIMLSEPFYFKNVHIGQ